MTALPPRADLTDNDMTAIRFSDAVAALRDYLAGLMGASGLPADALAGLGALVAGVLSRSAATTLGVEDRGRLVSCSGTWTLALPAAAAAGAGWAVLVANTGSGTVTLDPDGSETLDGAATAALRAGRAALLICTGTGWVSLALPGTAGGATLANDGSAAAPALAFSADTDTGLYAPANNQIALAAGGVQALLASTTALTAPLPVRLTSGTAAAPALTSTTAPGTGLWFPSGNVLAFSNTGVETLRLTAINRVFIGTQGSSVGGVPARLTVGGNDQSSSSVSIGRFSADADPLLLFISKSRGSSATDTTAVAVNDSLARIVVRAADGTSWANAAVIDVRATAVATGAVQAEWRFQTHDGTSLTTRMTLTAAGRLGIGTASPTVSLHVAGPVRVGSYTVATVPSASASGAGAAIYVSDESGGAVLAFSDGTNWRRTTDRAIVS